jgi:AraC-like DNA-binding protein
MVFRLHIPAYPLNMFIESFIYYRDYQPVHTVDRFLPDGQVNVVFDLTDYPKYIYDNNTLQEIQACRNVWFSGIRTTYITIPSGRDSEMFVINFHKGKAYPFMEMPMCELTDSVVDAELVLSPQILNLRELLLSTPEIARKFWVAEQYLMRHFGDRLVPNPFIDFAVNSILKLPDVVTVDEISRRVGYSQKHLISLFKEHVGITPKAFMRVMRFQKAIRDIEQCRQINWAQFATASGYYDQAHFINDFRSFSGFTPAQYVASKNDQLNYVPVG